MELTFLPGILELTGTYLRQDQLGKIKQVLPKAAGICYQPSANDQLAPGAGPLLGAPFSPFVNRVPGRRGPKEGSDQTPLASLRDGTRLFWLQ